ncbi:MAG: hypothetical protein NTV87_00145 [Ignavibacteriae bacterium]|nr:hypothetical protein [Ignavibacteriota bacterium]
MAFDGESIKGFFFSEIVGMKHIMNQSKRCQRLKGGLSREAKRIKGVPDKARAKARKLIKDFEILKKGGVLG